MKFFLAAILAVAVFCGLASTSNAESPEVLEANNKVADTECQLNNILKALRGANDEGYRQGLRNELIRYNFRLRAPAEDQATSSAFAEQVEKHYQPYLKSLKKFMDTRVKTTRPDYYASAKEGAKQCPAASTAIIYGSA